MDGVDLPNYYLSRIEPEPNSGCWLWVGARTSHGYGSVYCATKSGHQDYAHRAVWELLVGPICDETLDHLCRNRVCVNPRHLEPVTSRENKRRGMSPAAILERAVVCGRGHRKTSENTYTTRKGRKQCRLCHNLRSRKYYQEHPERWAK